MYTYIIIFYNTYIHVNASSGTCIPVKSWSLDIHQVVRAEVNTRSSSLARSLFEAHRQIQGPYPQGWEEIIVDQLTLRFCRVFFGWVFHGCTINNKQTKNKKKCKTIPTCNSQKFTTDDNNQPGHPKCLAISRMPWLLRSTVRKV